MFVVAPVLAAPPPPAGVTVMLNSGNQPLIRWTTVNGASGYRIARLNDATGVWQEPRTVSSTDSQYTDTTWAIDPSGPTEYSYNVQLRK